MEGNDGLCTSDERKKRMRYYLSLVLIPLLLTSTMCLQYTDLTEAYIIIHPTLSLRHPEKCRVISRDLRRGVFSIRHCGQFGVEKVIFLGYMISTDGISMDPDKIVVIVNWVFPSCVRDIQVVLGFCQLLPSFRSSNPILQTTQSDM